MARYLDPKSDLVFKRIFGEHKNLCISLLNSMLPLAPTQQVVEIEYNPSEIAPEIDALKNSIVDVRCTDNHSRQFIVEMQMYWTQSFKQRVLLNASKAYVNQLEKKKPFKLLQPVYALTFVNQNFDESPEYYHDYKIVNIKDTEKQIEGLEFVFIELQKFRPNNRAEQKLHELWMRFMTEIEENTEQIAPELLENSDIREAVQYAEKSAYTRIELDNYDKWLIDTLTAQSAMQDATDRGRTEGEEKAKIKIAHNLKTIGMSVENIAQVTGLSIAEIQNLK